MQLSTKSRYAARAMLELALHYGNGPLQLKEIAKRQDISDKYLEQVLFPLRTKGYIYTQKGNKGGYLLAKPPEEITMYDIVQTLEGSLAPVACADKPEICSRAEFCATKDLWTRLKDLIADELKQKTLAQLAEEQKNKLKETSESLMYYI